MRPIKLTMSAFGPYAGEAVVPFDELGEGIFMIAGNTGAGKTTIFDGITYALYGRASGDTRDAASLRSKYAQAATPTFVELTFSCKGQEYRIRRNPSYARPKKKNAGEMTTEAASQTLWLPDSRVLTKDSEVREEIEQIIGVSREQFSRIALIAQGDFLKLLLAKTDERSEIFRKIFNTDKYLALQKKVKEDYLAANGRVKEQQRSLVQYLNGLRCEEESPACEKTVLLKSADTVPADSLEIIEELINSDKSSCEELERRIKEKTDEKQKINAEVQIEENKNKTRKELKESQASLKAFDEQIMDAQKALETAEEHRDEIDNLKDKAARIEATFDDYDALDEKKIRIQAEKTGYDKLRKTSEAAADKAARLSEQIAGQEEELKTLSGAEARAEKSRHEAEKIREQKSALESLREEFESVLPKEEQLEAAQDRYLEDKAKAEAAKRTYECEYVRFLDEQAGIMAADLEEGMPCPVCGSTHHPAPKLKNTDAPSAASVEELKAEMEKTDEKLKRSSDAALELRTELDGLRKAVLKDAEELIGELDFEEVEDRLQAAQEETDQKLKIALADQKKAEKDLTTLREIEEQLPKDRESLKKVQVEIAELTEKTAASKAEILSFEKQIKEATEKLAMSDKAEAEKAAADLRKRADALKLAITNAENALKGVNDKKIKLKGRIEALKNAVGDSEEVDLSGKQQIIKELSEECEKMNSQRDYLVTSIDINTSVYNNIKSGMDELKTLEDRVRLLKPLSETINGEMTGKSKIRLETYVQMAFFDRIITKANTRLMVMSSGQYELRRRDDENNHGGQIGLELDVKDHYNGSFRAVSSLSGGESFVASLALALGMSDVVQAMSGGVQLDSLFIDEGFGTLDDEILEQTMKALADLGKSNKLVGLISHREELKARIDKQIIVTKEASGGSKIKITGI